jgi:cytohesin
MHPLHSAAASGDSAAAEALITTAAVDKTLEAMLASLGASNTTALTVAAAAGHATIVQQLLAAGASATFGNGIESGPLYEAAQNGHAQVVRMLLAAGADPDAGKWGFRMTALKAAVCGKHTAVVAALLKAGADPNVHDNDWSGSTPLHTAVRNSDAACCRLLLAAGADPNVANQNARSLLEEPRFETPLMLVQYSSESTTRCPALGKCANVHVDREEAHSNDAAADIIRALLDAGADPDGHSSGSKMQPRPKRRRFVTPLCTAAAAGHTEAVRALLAAGASPNMPDDDGECPLYYATVKRHTGVVHLLREAGAHPCTAC